MIDADLLAGFLHKFDNLKSVVDESSARSIRDPPDPLFYDHQNVFIKSYLVSACSMLEAYIQDLALAYVESMQRKISAANLPFNFIVWIAENEKIKTAFKPFQSAKTKADLSDLLSPSYWKTQKAFERFGVDISSEEVKEHKDFVSTMVDKRNRIVHEDDEALDLSFADISNAIDQFKDYARCLFVAVNNSPHLDRP